MVYIIYRTSHIMRVINQRSAPPSLGPGLAESDAQFFMPIFVGKIWYAYAIQQG